ncbi:serine O-acetyltransferase [Bacteroides fragilis]|uniref:serine O-acetyltransferase n=1 Tax=Bacteroides fragilis TaxID=817 RepID=UPI0018AF574F|nr:serine acetyltransferase [Bacteroides fragilis]
MTFKECKYLIKSDLNRLTKVKWGGGGVKYLFFNASFRITFWFRIGSYLARQKGIFFKLLYRIVFLIHKHNQYLTGIQLPIGTQIGEGLCFAHFSCIVINSTALIGKNCTIYHGVTIGGVRGPKGGAPIIGDNVVISSGAKIIGKVRIGNNVMIGSGAIVVKDIPDNAVVVGNPGKVISYNGKDHIQYFVN